METLREYFEVLIENQSNSGFYVKRPCVTIDDCKGFSTDFIDYTACCKKTITTIGTKYLNG